MPQYKFSAMNEKGKTVKGSTDAKNAEHLKEKLKNKGLYLTTFVLGDFTTTIDKSYSDTARHFASRVNERVLMDFFYQLATMIKSGIAIVLALSSLQSRTKRYNYFIKKLYTDVFNGMSLSEAIEQQPRHFSSLIFFTVKAGENSGNLDKQLTSLADSFNNNLVIRRKLKGAIAYPMFLLVFLAIVSFLQTMIVHSIKGYPLTKISSLSVTIFSILGVLFLLYLCARIPIVKPFLDYMKLKIPPFKSIAKKIYTMRFAETLSRLYASGMNVVDALPYSISSTDNYLITKYLANSSSRILNGESIADIVGGCPYFEDGLVGALVVGEKTGVVEDEMNRIVKNCREEMPYAFTKLTKGLNTGCLIIVIFFIFAFLRQSGALSAGEPYKEAGL